MSYFCILSNSVAFPNQDHSCLKMGQCSSCRDYQRGAFAPRFPVPALPEHSPEYKHPQKLVDYASMRAAQISYAGY